MLHLLFNFNVFLPDQFIPLGIDTNPDTIGTIAMSRVATVKAISEAISVPPHI